MQIYKYKLGFQITKPIEMPAGAVILSVQLQDNELVLWAIVDPTAAPVTRTFRLAVTGEEISKEELADLNYLGTFLADGERFVGHVFERIR